VKFIHLDVKKRLTFVLLLRGRGRITLESERRAKEDPLYNFDSAFTYCLFIAALLDAKAFKKR
jgi:hypothetical protein